MPLVARLAIHGRFCRDQSAVGLDPTIGIRIVGAVVAGLKHVKIQPWFLMGERTAACLRMISHQMIPVLAADACRQLAEGAPVLTVSSLEIEVTTKDPDQVRPAGVACADPGTIGERIAIMQHSKIHPGSPDRKQTDMDSVFFRHLDHRIDVLPVGFVRFGEIRSIKGSVPGVIGFLEAVQLGDRHGQNRIEALLCA